MNDHNNHSTSEVDLSADIRTKLADEGEAHSCEYREVLVVNRGLIRQSDMRKASSNGESEQSRATDVSLSLSYPGVSYEERRLKLPENLPFDEWQRIGVTLIGIERSIQWALGDWWVFGERKYGERAAQAVEGRDYATIHNYGWVARKFPSEEQLASPRGEVYGPNQTPSRTARNLAVPFSSHREMASLDEDMRGVMLDRAAAQNWTVRQVKKEVYQAKALLGPTEPPPYMTTAEAHLAEWCEQGALVWEYPEDVIKALSNPEYEGSARTLEIIMGKRRATLVVPQ